MLKKTAVVSFCLLQSLPVLAQMPYLEEMKALGTVSGQGLVCGAEKYDQFEMLARAIMLTKAPNNDMLQKGVYAYTEAKASVYMNKQLDGGYLCREIAERFNNQDIFSISLYEDGTIKMPDGTVITPKVPYDATKIYKKDNHLKENLKTLYNGAANKARDRVLKHGGKVSTSSEDYNAGTAARPLQPIAPAVPLPSAPSSAAYDNRTANSSESSIGHISRSYR